MSPADPYWFDWLRNFGDYVMLTVYNVFGLGYL